MVVEVCRSRTAVMYDREPQEEGSKHAPQSNSMSLRWAPVLADLIALRRRLQDIERIYESKKLATSIVCHSRTAVLCE